MSKRVPSALYSELSEYNALLRALRTSNTQDLATQLTQSIPTVSTSLDAHVDKDIDEDDLLDSDPISAGTHRRPDAALGEDTTGSQPVVGTSENLPDTKSRKRKRTPGTLLVDRDTWTRWPLPSGEVPPPEWSLEDEVQTLALQLLKHSSGEELDNGIVGDIFPAQEPPPDISHSHTIAVASTTEDPPDENPSSLPAKDTSAAVASSSDVSIHHESDTDDDDALSSSAVKVLTASASSQLSSMLSALAAHVPVTEKSMHNRVHPIGWETVLEVVGAYNLADPASVDNVRHRMESMYVVRRMEASSGIIERVRELVDPHELDFLSLAPYDLQVATPKRKRGPYKKRKVKEESHPPQEPGGSSSVMPDG